jgi:hypothetical protein
VGDAVIKRVLIIVGVFLVLAAAGGREAMGFLSGSQPVGEGVPLLGAGYFVAWFALVLVAPVLTIAAALSAVYGRITWLRSWIASRRR